MGHAHCLKLKKQVRKITFQKWGRPNRRNDARVGEAKRQELQGQDGQGVVLEEDLKILLENPANKTAVAKSISDKVIWPWIKTTDDDYEKRKQILLKAGYKEWKPTGKAKSTASKWGLRYAAEPKTDTGSNSSDTSDSDSGSTDNATEADEDEDDEV